MKTFHVPLPLEADAYQLGHFELIPCGMNDFQVAQATFRKQFSWGDSYSDQRVQFSGMLAMAALELDDLVLTEDDLDDTDHFLRKYRANPANPGKPLAYPWDRDMFERIIHCYDGKLPICVMGLPEGQAHYIGEPCFQVFSDEKGMGELCGHLESTWLPYLWASSAVGTRGRIRKAKMVEELKKDFPNMTEQELVTTVEYLFHDFGRRGAAASQITGIAHLLNFLGTDTTDAAYVAERYLNNWEDFGARSIVAAAHRTVTPWATESMSIDNIVAKFGNTIFAFVADSYGYSQGIRKLAQRLKVVRARGGWIVGRPDSGDPVQCIIEGLRVLEAALAPLGGVETLPCGLKVLKGASIIQGDGVSDNLLFSKIYPAVRTAGFSIINVAIGMGEYNHRAVRSDLEMAQKTVMVGVSEVPGEDVIEFRGVMKDSNTDFKRSLPTPVSFHRSGGYERRIRPITAAQLRAGQIGDYVVYYDGRPNPLPVYRPTFSEARETAWRSWNELLPNRPCDTLDPEIRQMQRRYMEEQHSAGAL